MQYCAFGGEKEAKDQRNQAKDAEARQQSAGNRQFQASSRENTELQAKLVNFQLIFKQGARKSTNSWRTQIIYRRIQPIARSIAIKQKKPEKIKEVKEIQEKTATRNHKSERNKITKILRKTQKI